MKKNMIAATLAAVIISCANNPNVEYNRITLKEATTGQEQGTHSCLSAKLEGTQLNNDFLEMQFSNRLPYSILLEKGQDVYPRITLLGMQYLLCLNKDTHHYDYVNPAGFDGQQTLTEHLQEQ